MWRGCSSSSGGDVRRGWRVGRRRKKLTWQEDEDDEEDGDEGDFEGKRGRRDLEVEGDGVKMTPTPSQPRPPVAR